MRGLQVVVITDERPPDEGETDVKLLRPVR